MSYRFTDNDLAQLAERGISRETAAAYLATFARGLPYCVLDRPCTVGDGVVMLSREDVDRYGRAGAAAARSGRVMKFVPASGAATRMFESLLAASAKADRMDMRLDDLRDMPEYEPVRTFLANIERFAFFPELRRRMRADGKELEALARAGIFPEILSYLLTERGLGYAGLPKGLIKFHRYGDYGRTPMEEHLVEAKAYAADGHGCARLHFTVAEEQRTLAAAHIEAVRGAYESGVFRYEATFSVQHPSTDTLAADSDNEPFREGDGRMVFRPGGHGALLENLEELGGDVVLIKNIDNVVPDRLKEPTILYKKALCGYLVELQRQIFDYLRRLDDHKDDASLVHEAMEFARKELAVAPASALGTAARYDYIREKLDRPLRVCGVVRASGEPGGGPFWVRTPDGSCSPQIVESSEVKLEDEAQRAIFNSATHFNPVDLACGVRDVAGTPFDLLKFRDAERGFISMKSKDGKPLKALEHPGLWNGGMARWNTVFVEVPEATFNPVKTVLDLLRKEHLTAE